MVGCEKESYSSHINIDVLADQATSRLETEEEFEKITQQYRKLSLGEMEEFFKLSLIKMQEKNEKINLSPEEIEKICSFRKKIFLKSIEVFGKNFNQLSADEARHLTEMERRQQPLAKASCSTASYPYSACRTTVSGTDWTGYDRYATPNDPNDCDYEYRFTGFKNYTYGSDWFARKLLDHWGGCIIKRYSGGYTRLLFGQWGVRLWIGIPQLTSVEMR